MNCRRFRDLMVIGFYGGLTEEQKRDLELHRSRCSQCNTVYLKTKSGYSHSVPEKNVPTLLKERSWSIIAHRMRQTKSGRSSVFSVARAVRISSLLAVVLAAGILIGRWGFRPRFDFEDFAYSPDSRGVVSLEDYLDDLHILFIDTLNRSGRTVDREILSLGERAARELLEQTRLWKRHFSQSSDPEFYGYLENVELILIGISHLRPEDKDSIDQINRMIREKWLLSDSSNQKDTPRIF